MGAQGTLRHVRLPGLFFVLKKALGCLDKTHTLPLAESSLEAALYIPVSSWDLLFPSDFLPGFMPSYLPIPSCLPLADPFL